MALLNKSFYILSVLILQIMVGLSAAQDAPETQPKKEVNAAEAIQREFFQAVQSGDTANVVAMMHPALRELVDEPVLVAWTAKVNELGPLGEIKSKTEAVPDNVPSRTVSNANVSFESCTANSQLESVDGQLVAFKVESDRLKDWFEGPATTDLYEEIGRTFIRRFLLKQGNSAFNMCHPELQKLVDGKRLYEMIATITDAGGKLTSLRVTETKNDFSNGVQKLNIKYRVECEKSDMTCLVTFQFVGMKGHLVAFKFN